MWSTHSPYAPLVKPRSGWPEWPTGLFEIGCDPAFLAVSYRGSSRVYAWELRRAVLDSARVQNFADLIRECGWCERLLQKLNSLIEHSVMGDGVVGIARH